jgi:hypothetical protein
MDASGWVCLGGASVGRELHDLAALVRGWDALAQALSGHAGRAAELAAACGGFTPRAGGRGRPWGG